MYNSGNRKREKKKGGTQKIKKMISRKKNKQSKLYKILRMK